MTLFAQEVYNIVRKIPKGKIATYTQVAEAVRKPRAARAVGNVLAMNQNKKIPCYRVIKSSGVVGKYNNLSGDKLSCLKKEGVIIKNNSVDLTKFQCCFF